MAEPSAKMKAVADRMVAAVRAAIDRAIAMRDETAQEKIKELTVKLDTLERRASRQGEHLAALENKVQALQRR